MLLSGLGYQITVPKILLPVGLSFFVFQSSTYILDLCFGKIKAEHNLLDYALFVSFFPTITSGPIQRARLFLPKVKEREMPDFAKIEEATFVFLWGAFLKSVIADRLAVFTDAIYSDYTQYGGFLLIVCAFAYSVQIYVDFAGYSYMAVAIAKLFGFDLTENFHQPYFAKTIVEFWRRWHISLTSWFTEYLYIPLGGNRKGQIRRYLNILVVFLVSGLWHGAGWNFIAWGGIHAVYQIVGYLTKNARAHIRASLNIGEEKAGYQLWQRIFIFFATSFAWIFFRAPSLTAAVGYIKNMLSVWNPWVLFDKTLFSFGLDGAEWNVLVLSLIVLVVVSYFREQGKNVLTVVGQNTLCKAFLFEILIFILFVFGMYGDGYSASSFIYAGF